MKPRRVLDSFPRPGCRPSWSYLHTGTLLRLISFICHSYENTGGVGAFFPFWNSSPILLLTNHCPLTCPDPVGATCHYRVNSFSCNTYGPPRKCCKQKTYGRANSFRCNTYKKQSGTLRQAKSCSLFGRFSPKSFSCHRSENSPVSPTIATLPRTHLSKSSICHTSETPREVVTPNIPTNLSTFQTLFDLLIDVVLCFQALQQWLEKWLRRIGRYADRHHHFLGRGRKISRVRRDSRQRQVAGPMIRILLGDLRIDLKRALGVSRSLQAPGVGVQLNRGGFIERLGKRLSGFFFSSPRVEEAGFGLKIFKSLFILDRSVFPLQRFFQVVIVVQAPLRRLVVSAPCEPADAPKLVFDALQRHRFHVHRDVERNRQLLPAQSCCRRIRFDFLKRVRN